MRISVWDRGALKESSLEELSTGYRKTQWFDITDPSVEDLERVAEALKVPRNALLGKLSSNYPHIDSYPEYTKIFAWYLNTKGTGKDITSDMGPVIVFTNGRGVVSISQSWIGVSEAVSSEFASPRLALFSPIARVAYLVLSHVIDSYEHFVDNFEENTEKYEDESPPWSRSFYMEAFIIRREASSLLRLLHHFKRLAEVLTDGKVELGISLEERRLFDGVIERAIGAEETTESTRETMQDLIGIHMDVLSLTMNRTMRLIAALTVIVGVPSLIGALFGSNTMDAPYKLLLWQVVVISGVAVGILTAFFYVEGWLRIR